MGKSPETSPIPGREPRFSLLARGISPNRLGLSEIGDSGIYNVTLNRRPKGRLITHFFGELFEVPRARLVGVYPNINERGKYSVLGGQRCIIPVAHEEFILSLGSYDAQDEGAIEQEVFVFSRNGKVIVASAVEGNETILDGQSSLELGRDSEIFESTNEELDNKRDLAGMWGRHAFLGLLSYDLVDQRTAFHTGSDIRIQDEVPLVLFENVSLNGSTVFLV